eukprot:TRINITY_DN14289_c0_g1::TRINITY_DN14289_c0_g1_i1::g.13670::m.13670 TRINITY_DN14289_c0_g1::TRINITY_DN14289_c0_g1_i1::g.13670  ORF type:complete len:175 (-),score=38.27,CS/PF04969.11/2.3e+03,CS/PF04969.11/1.9e-07 TRINITY_DN14289_c0_g1_i1:43-567(-)
MVDQEATQPELSSNSQAEGPKKAIDVSLESKGQHSYYYWHRAPSLTTDRVEVTAPKLLAVEQRETTATVITKSIDKYAWMDDDNKIKIYVELDPLSITGDLKEEQISTTFDAKRVEMKIMADEKTQWRLVLDRLNEDIVAEESNARQRKNKIIITLKKKEDRKWFKLREDKPIV